MPDMYGFDHLPNWGQVSHRCIECEEFPFGTRLSEAQRRRHHEKHVRDRTRETERQRKANLAKARQALRMKERENDLVYGEEG